MKTTLLSFLCLLLSFSIHAQIDTTVYEVNANFALTDTLKGQFRTVEFKSESLNELREISIYEPPNFQKDTVYDLVILTDNMCLPVASMLEKEMLENRMKPVLIVGINNREAQAVDTLFEGYDIDFRMKEMLGDIWFTKNQSLQKDSIAASIFKNRHENFMKWVNLEVVAFLEEHYNLSSRNNWTLGGFSNGGSVVLKINSVYPNSFGHVISMSPSDITSEITAVNSKYYLCAGIEETSFHERSLTVAEFLQNHNVTVQHRTYNCGHNYNMWMNYYFTCLTSIYKVLI